MSDDRRLIEDLIPVEAINEVSVKEKVGGRQSHPALLHLWWARRPLAAARAAVYATLVRAADTPEEARSAGYFHELCRWGASETAIADARKRVLASNGGVPPKVLDLFAGGGAIPLEAARLGCEATAVELNPVAHLIERCMLDYPQRFGSSLADDIRHWGEQWVARTWQRVGHLYPPVEASTGAAEASLFSAEAEPDGPAVRAAGRPIAYLWTRTVPCPNPALGAHAMALVRQTWLSKKKGRHLALRPRVDREALRVEWEIAGANDAEGLGFDPAGFSRRGSSTCLVCGATADGDYIKKQGRAGRMGIAPLAAVMIQEGGRGRTYLAAGDYDVPNADDCAAVLADLRIQPPDELIQDRDTLNFKVPLYGLTRFRDLFTLRQLATLCSFAQGIRETYDEMTAAQIEPERAEAISAFLALVLDRVVDRSSTLCRFDITNEGLTNTYARQALPMVWDFGESNPFASASGGASKYVENVAEIAAALAETGRRVEVQRTSATQLPDHDETFDAVITDPPYYDNISYSDLSDFFYVWLKRSIGFLFPEHLEGELTPKRHEAIVAPYRHDGDKSVARAFYEHEMASAFAEAHRVLKPGAPLVCVYAHKTTLGWAALVEALRRAGFLITEAWPLDTEMPERSIGQGTASLASSIFLVARRRDTAAIGQYAEVQRELDQAIAERIDRLTTAGVAGSDLVIATIGAGLRAFTRFASVELPNGEEVPAERFLEEVQARVLNAVLARVHGLADGVGAIDAATRYYVTARYALGYADVDFDEANNLARTAGVELSDLTGGRAPLAEVRKGKVRLLDFEARGDEPTLGIEGDNGSMPRLVDVLHGLLWRAAHDTRNVRTYLDEARPDGEKLRLVAQALQGKGLRMEGDQKPAEAQACERLLGSWRSLVEPNLFVA
jgi:putative DNA methylase